MTERWSRAEEKRVHEDTFALISEAVGGRPVESFVQLKLRDPELAALLAPEERATIRARSFRDMAAFKAAHDEARRKTREYMAR